MRNGERRYRRSKSSNSDSDNEDHRRQTTLAFRRSFPEERNNKVSSTCLLTLSLLAALGTSSSLLPSTDLTKMESYRNSEMTPSMDMPLAYKPRPQRLRYRDDLAMMKYSMQKNGQEYNAFNMPNEPMMMMPIVTERPRTNHLLPRTMMSPTTSTQSSNQQDPSLEDMELIDVLWRNDIASEKGQHPFAPSDQYERDLQLLTEKSIREPLTHSESARYEDLAKGYFEDFFFPMGCKNEYPRREVCTPTDEDLQTLLDDVSSGQLDVLLEDRQLDQLCPNGLLEPHGPIINNVTLGQGIIFDANNVTELNTYEVPACSTITEGELFSNGTMDSPSWPQQTNMGPSDIFPSGPQEALFPMFPQNDTNVPIISTGIQYNHTYTSNTVSSNTDSYEGYYVPNGLSNYSNESSSVCSSSTSSKSPSYLSEAENMPPVSRYYGKLAPNPSDIQLYSQEDVKDNKSVDDSDSTCSAPRRRGRQSKDEQLAKMNNLPLTAKDIAEMSLADLQKMLKSEKLTEMQKTLIKKIRRRGKNKVAARTCRQRRGDKSTKNDQDQWNTQLESQA